MSGQANKDDRLDRIERMLEQSARRQDRTDEQIASNAAQIASNAKRQERTDEQIAGNAAQIAGNAKRQERTERNLERLVEVTDRLIGRNAEQIGHLINEMNFLRIALQGRTTGATAHRVD